MEIISQNWLHKAGGGLCSSIAFFVCFWGVFFGFILFGVFCLFGFVCFCEIFACFVLFPLH